MSKSIKIFQAISHYIPAYRYGGPLYVAHALGRAFVKSGHAVTVCTTSQKDETTDLGVEVDVPIVIDGVTVYYEPVRMFRYWGFSPSLWKRMSREIAAADLVIIHAHYQFANWAGAWLARKYRKPYVIFAHGSLHRSGVVHKSELVKRAYLAIMEQRNMESALFVAFNAPEEMKSSLYGYRGRVVPNGIDSTQFDPMPERGFFRKQYPQTEGKRCLLFLGRLDIEQKGLDFLIPAFARLFAQHPDTHLVLAGPDEAGGAEAIGRLIDFHHVRGAVTMTGLISGPVKLAALQDVDYFVLPSRFEGMSIALLEALYVGLPLLVTDRVGLCGEIDTVGAGLVVQANTEAVYAGLCELLRPEVSVPMRGRGTELVMRKYAWDAIAENLMDQIREVAASQH